ncbi:gustatory and odorant receptor 24-like [Periplaneta americana]|uniref:gustatory and odorant receptor 24-like n=1 Tax=Periplaneta americana TaxID=6978 RepID=UPI0037E83152
MKSEDFLDVASEADRALNTLTLRITQVSWIRVACDHQTLVLTRNNLSDSEQWKTCQVVRRGRTLQSVTNLEKNSSKAEKEKYLLAMLDFMDTKYHGFYKDLFSGHMSFRFLSPETLYSIAVIGFLIVASVYTEIDRFKKWKNPTKSFSLDIVEYAARIFIASLILVPINQWPEIKKKIRFINSWASLQVEFRLVTGRNLFLALRRKLLIVLGIIAPILTYFLTEGYLMNLIMHWWELFIFGFAFASTFLLPVAWIFTCSGIIKIARELGDEIEERVSDKVIIDPNKICQYKKLWLRLKQLTQDLGSSSGYTYGGQALLHFTLNVLMIFAFLVELCENFNYCYLTSGLLFQAIILLECDAAEKATQEWYMAKGQGTPSIRNIKRH